MPLVNDAWLQSILVQALGDRFPGFQGGGFQDSLQDLDGYESILYSLEKQDLIFMVEALQSLSVSTGFRGALHSLLKKLTDVLEISHCSLIMTNLEREEGTVAVSHEDPDFEGVRISLDLYPEILRSLRTGEITIVKNPSKDPLMHSLEKNQIRKIREVSIMVLPLSFEGKVFATLLVRKQRSEEGFLIREVRICQLVAYVVLRFLHRMCATCHSASAPLGEDERQEKQGQAAERQDWDAAFQSMLFGSVPVGILLLDGECNIVRANPKASEITGVPQEQLLAMKYDDIVPEKWIREIVQKREGAGPMGQEMNRYHVPYRASGGKQQILSVERHPFPGQDSFSWVFFRDVSKEKKLEERLENQKTQLLDTNRRLKETRAKLLDRYEDLQRTNERLEELNKVKTHFLAVATHEIRTPLSVIIGYNNFLLQGRAGRVPSTQRRILEESVQSCERLLNIVSEMLDLSRTETGTMRLQIKDTDLRVLLERVYRQMKIMSDRVKIDFRLEMPEEPVLIPHDPDRIEQVLVNLISNSIKFTPPGGLITLSARRLDAESGAFLEVTVSDTGAGISQAALDKILRDGQMFLSEPAGSGAGKGVGMGLAICSRIVEAHNGTLDAESSEGEGATFKFHLPFCR